MIKYTIPDIPPSNNEYIGKNKWREYSRAKKDWTDLVCLFCRPRPKSPISHSRVTLTYFFPDNRRRDPDNYSGKMILDGLTKAGIIEDDSFKHIDLSLQAKLDRENPRVEITIEELDGA